MKLVLASQGFTTPEIAHAVADLVGKPAHVLNVAIINEAYIGIEDGRHQGWLISELSQIPHYCKGTVSFVNLRAYDIQEVEQRCEFADLIYIVGGAQLVLRQLFRETGFDKLLFKMAGHKVIMGTSAGANVLGRQIEDPAFWLNQYGSADEYLSNPFLGLVDFNILPHFNREDRPDRTHEVLTPLLNDSPFPLYGITDTQAVIYENGSLRFIGGEPAVFGKSN